MELVSGLDRFLLSLKLLLLDGFHYSFVLRRGTRRTAAGRNLLADLAQVSALLGLFREKVEKGAASFGLFFDESAALTYLLCSQVPTLVGVYLVKTHGVVGARLGEDCFDLLLMSDIFFFFSRMISESDLTRKPRGVGVLSIRKEAPLSRVVLMVC